MPGIGGHFGEPLLIDRLKARSATPTMSMHQAPGHSLVHRPQLCVFTSTFSGERAELKLSLEGRSLRVELRVAWWVRRKGIGEEEGAPAKSKLVLAQRLS